MVETKIDIADDMTIDKPDTEDLRNINAISDAIYPVIAGRNLGDVATVFSRLLVYGIADEDDVAFDTFLTKFVELMRLDRTVVRHFRAKAAN